MLVKYLLINLVIAALLGFLGKNRKWGFWGNFAVTYVLSAVVGVIVLLAQEKKVEAIEGDVKPA